MEFRQIQYFDAVYRNTSISKAAQELFVTQQCISKQISMLEKELGAPLFIRRSNGIVPTAEGQWFYEHAIMILQIESDIQEHFQQVHDKDHRKLRIGVSNGLNMFYDDIFFRHLRTKQAEQPSIQVFYMWNRQIEEMLEENTIDIGISILPVCDETLYVKKLFSEPICCIVRKGHPLAKYDVLRFDDIIREPIAMADENYNTFYAFRERCNAQGVHPNVYKAPDLMSIYEYVLNHPAIGFSFEAYKKRFDLDQIQYIPYDDIGNTWDICILMQKKDMRRYKNLISEFTAVV